MNLGFLGDSLPDSERIVRTLRARERRSGSTHGRNSDIDSTSGSLPNWQLISTVRATPTLTRTATVPP